MTIVHASKILTADTMASYNDFDHPEDVILKDFIDYELKNGHLTIKMPAKSVLTLQLSTADGM